MTLEQDGMTKQERSPRYPAITFTEALEKAEAIWKREKRNAMSVDLACQHLGYKAKNGASLPVLAALKRYGLLISIGTEIRVSDEANTLFIAPQGHPERLSIVRKLAMLPSMFGEVLGQFPDGLPSDDNLRFRLQREMGFASAKAADAFILALKDSMSVAGIADGAALADNAAANSAQEPRSVPEPSAISPESIFKSPFPFPASRVSAPPNERSWDLGEGTTVRIVVPANLSKNNVAKLKKYVAALEMEASISWDDDLSSE